MTPEEMRAYSREYYRLHRDSILAYKKRKGYSKAYYASLSDEQKEEYNRRRRERGYDCPCYQKKRMMYHTEEYRAKRREDYAKKHANDPMTPHREKIIAAMKEVVKTPIELRRAKRQFIKDSKLCHES